MSNMKQFILQNFGEEFYEILMKQFDPVWKQCIYNSFVNDTKFQECFGIKDIKSMKFSSKIEEENFYKALNIALNTFSESIMEIDNSEDFINKMSDIIMHINTVVTLNELYYSRIDKNTDDTSYMPDENSMKDKSQNTSGMPDEYSMMKTSVNKETSYEGMENRILEIYKYFKKFEKGSEEE